MDKFTLKEVFVLVFIIVTGISFLETSDPIFSTPFFKDFIGNVLVYGFVSELLVVFWSYLIGRE
jgi:hypothetical protein